MSISVEALTLSHLYLYVHMLGLPGQTGGRSGPKKVGSQQGSTQMNQLKTISSFYSNLFLGGHLCTELEQASMYVRIDYISKEEGEKIPIAALF